ncbi:MAG: hypothetical protein NTV86_12525, partial [Planctomycetota bacterium]|nr:hypothetical protein [Planctomycetota bacterium]
LEEVRRINPVAPVVVVVNKCDLGVSPGLGFAGPDVDESGARSRLRLGFADPDVDESGARCRLRLGVRDDDPSISPPIPTSAVTGAGLSSLRLRIESLLHTRTVRSGGSLGLHQRQKRSLLAASASAARAGELLSAASVIVDVAELAAVELRDALAHLGAISGQVVTDDILGLIFRRFCVGK